MNHQRVLVRVVKQTKPSKQSFMKILSALIVAHFSGKTGVIYYLLHTLRAHCIFSRKRKISARISIPYILCYTTHVY